MRSHRYVLFLLFFLGLAMEVRANDSSAKLETGGLRLTNSHDITMEAEELFLSFGKVRVRYRFRNQSKQDIVTLVAFPLPEISVGEDANYSVETDDTENFLRFEVRVDRSKVTPSLELRATLNGLDQTPLLRRHGIPILPFGDGFYTRLENIPVAARAELEQAGVVDWRTSWGANNVPLPSPHWTAHATYYWKQKFPAGRTIEVTHRYKPVPAVSFYGEHLFESADLGDTYCMDASFRKAMKRLFARKPNGFMRELHYILTTAANWSGQIGDFRVTIDKGKPENLISLCIDGIRKTGPTTFEMRAKDFVPVRDLKILLLEPHGG